MLVDESWLYKQVTTPNTTYLFNQNKISKYCLLLEKNRPSRQTE